MATLTNADVAERLEELAKLSAIDGEDQFKVRAYENAAESVRSWPHELSKYKVLPKMPGIGPSIGQKIISLFQNNGSFKKLDNLRERWGHALKLTQYPGIGPATAKKLFVEHGAITKADLQALVKKGIITDSRTVEALSGKGEKTRIPYDFARETADKLIAAITRLGSASVGQVMACGSLRRKKPDVGDIDIVICTEEMYAKHFASVLTVVKVSGEKKVSGFYAGCQVDLRVCKRSEFGAMILYFTGSKEFNVSQRALAKSKKLTLNEYGLHDGAIKIAGETEKGIFEALGLDYVPPEDR